MTKRPIIVHFHFFKNAGTSVEMILHDNFRDAFVRYDPGEATDTLPANALLPVLEENESIRAISSHTVCYPPPRRAGWSFFPIIFLRHPLDRILSMYNYEKGQDEDTPGTLLAKMHGLAGYIKGRLKAPGERTIRNYQTWMLGQRRAPVDDPDGQLEAAVHAVQKLPVVGVVEEFETSIRQFNDWLAPHFPGLEMVAAHHNRSRKPGTTLGERIQRIREAIGDSLFRRIERNNKLDLELYRLARQRLGTEN